MGFLLAYPLDFLTVRLSPIFRSYFLCLLCNIGLFLVVSDFDAVCDLQARAVKNSEAVGRKRATGSSKKGVANVKGGDPSDGEGVGDIAGGIAGTDPPANSRGASTTIPAVSAPATKISSRKGKKKVGASGSGTDVPIFDVSVPEVP